MRELEEESHRIGRNADHQACVEAAHALVWKPSLCLPPWTLGIQMKAPVVLSGCYEAGPGTAALLEYAAACRGGNCAAGIDTYSRLADDVLDTRLPVAGAEADLQAVNAALETLNTHKLNRLWHV